jgi:hypothetical protein
VQVILLGSNEVQMLVPVAKMCLCVTVLCLGSVVKVPSSPLTRGSSPPPPKTRTFMALSLLFFVVKYNGGIEQSVLFILLAALL